MAAKARNIVSAVLGSLFVALLAGVLAIQSPSVQKRIADKFLSKLTEHLDGRVSFSSVRVMPSGSILIKDLAIIDTNPYIDHDTLRAHPPVDTLFYGKTVAATFTLKGLLSDEGLHLSRLSLDNAIFHLTDNPTGPTKSNIQRMFNLPFAKEEPQEGGNIFDIRKVRASDIAYKMTLYKSQNDWTTPGLHMADLHITSPVVEGHGVKFTKGRLHAVLDRMEWKEEGCGLEVRSMTGRCTVGMGRTIVEDFHVEDDWSDINFDIYTMDYRNTYAFRRFTDEVKIGCTFAPSVASARTISILTGGGLKDSDLLAEIWEGRFDGFVNNFTLSNFSIHDRPSGVSADVEIDAEGITKPKSARLTLDVKSMHFTTPQLAHLLSGMTGGKAGKIAQYAPEEHFTIKGRASGMLNRINAALTLGTGESSATAEAVISNLVSRPDSLLVSGLVGTTDVDASLFTGKDVVRNVSLTSKVDAVLKKGDPRIRVDSLIVDRLNFKGYDYHALRIDGTLDGGTVRARISSSDPNLRLGLNGRFDIKPRRGYSAYKLNGEISGMDLKELGFDTRDSVSRASGQVYVDFLSHSGIILGDAQIGGVRLTNSTGTHDIGDVMIGAHMLDGRQGLNISSDFADASYSGSKSVTKLIAGIKKAILSPALPFLFEKGDADEESGDCEIGLHFHDSRELMSFVWPGIYIADSTRVNVSLDGGQLQGGITSPRLAYGSKFLKDTRIDFDNDGGGLNASVSGSLMKAGILALSNPSVSASAKDDRIAASLKYDGISGSGDNAEINLSALLLRDSTDTLAVSLGTSDSFLKLGGDVWDVSDSDILIRGDRITFDRFRITSGDQHVTVKGGMSKTGADTLDVRVEGLNLAVIDAILPNDFGFEGIAGGQGYLRSPYGNALGLLANFGCESLKIGGADAGSIRMAGKWDDETSSLGVSLSNMLAGREALYAHLSYSPDTKDVEAKAMLDGFSLKTAAPFLSKVFSEIDGGIGGEIRVGGKVGDLRMESRDVTLDDVLLTVAYTGVPYTLNGPVRITSEGVFLDGIDVADSSDGHGTIQGRILHSQLKNPKLDAKVNFDDLLVMNKAYTGGSDPYGRIRASGNASVKGPFEALQIDANVSTSGQGDLHVGMSGALSSNGPSNLLTFVERQKKVDPYEEMLQELAPAKKAAADLAARAKVTVNPGLKAFIEIDKDAGNVISFNGSGSVNIDIHTAKDMVNLNGDYSINEGNYTFVIPGILKRDFVIKNGSTVKFGGDLSDSDLDIETVYNLKTSLSTLIADSTVVASRRLVECGIGISGKLNNPEIDFNINVPDLDPTTRSQVESALNTEDKVQKQFVALLIMGSFLPSEASGIFNGTNMLYSNAADIFSNQLSNILQKLEIPLDLGIDYQGLQSGTSIFDVAISTELFNNRVVVNGSVGNRRYSTSTNPNGDMVGDLDIQVKLDQPGRVRFNIFSHSADEYTSYLDFSQRNGIGLSYQKEFNKYADLFRPIFVPKAKRAAKAASNEPQPEKEVIIRIDNEQRKAVSDTISAGGQ